MKKQSKLLMSSVGLIAGVCIFATTAFAAINNLSGYEKAKEAIIQTSLLDNFTATSTISFNMGENEKMLQSSVTKKEGKNTSIKSFNEDGTTSMETYTQDGYMITKYGKNEEYQGFELGNMGIGQSDNPTETEMNFLSALVDTIVGDLKNYVITENNEVYVELSENQVPAVAQLGLLAMSEEFKNTTTDYMTSGSPLQSDQFYLIYDVLTLDKPAFKKVNINLKLDEQNRVQNTKAIITIGGTDDNGTVVETTFECELTVSDINQTVADKVDMDNVRISEHTISKMGK